MANPEPGTLTDRINEALRPFAMQSLYMPPVSVCICRVCERSFYFAVIGSCRPDRCLDCAENLMAQPAAMSSLEAARDLAQMAIDAPYGPCVRATRSQDLARAVLLLIRRIEDSEAKP